MHRKGLHVGTSGWVYDDWRGRLYPERLPQRAWLAHYAACFDTVEINATFYRLPSEKAVRGWDDTMPPGFSAVVKASAVITHRKRLADCDDLVARFSERLSGFSHLDVVLWQLPPTFQRNDARLAAFLDRLSDLGFPPKVRHAFEFRHESWWHDDVRRLLARARAAFVAVSRAPLPADILPTGDLLYVRFHGLGDEGVTHEYTRAELRAWARKLRPLSSRRTLYAFFNNDPRAAAVRNALVFRALLANGG